MPESESADDSGLEYTPPLYPWCTSGQYWPSSDGPVYRASSRWVSCFTAFVTRGRPMQGLCRHPPKEQPSVREETRWVRILLRSGPHDLRSGPQLDHNRTAGLAVRTAKQMDLNPSIFSLKKRRNKVDGLESCCNLDRKPCDPDRSRTAAGPQPDRKPCGRLRTADLGDSKPSSFFQEGYGRMRDNNAGRFCEPFFGARSRTAPSPPTVCLYQHEREETIAMALSTDVVEEARRSGSSTTGLGYLRIPPAHTPPLPSELQPQFATAKRGRREKKDEQ
ncbi:hypothetical protein THAOC_12434, partial [Thalassiosira oceanica]